MVLVILRGAFILLVAVVATLFLLANQPDANVSYGYFIIALLVTLAIAGAIIGLDAGFKRKKLSAASGVFLGLLAGLFAAYSLSFVVDLYGLYNAPEVTAVQPKIEPASTEYFHLTKAQQDMVDTAENTYQTQVAQRKAYLNLLEGVKVLIGLITCYLGISLVLQTKDDFRFVLPYVEFSKQIRGNRPIILDTSVIIDGRILDVIGTHMVQGTLVVPKFVLEELQNVADSSDKLRRARGRRGLDILQKLQEEQQIVEVVIDETDPDAPAVDHKLIALAQQMEARVMTNDYNLNKIATLRGVDVVNINDLAKALRPVVLPGERMSLRLVKPGETPSQGVGYLEDGTMVVVEEGRDHLHEQVSIAVTSTLQTSAGRMIFGRYEHRESDGDGDGPAGGSSSSAAASTTGDSTTGGSYQNASGDSSNTASRSDRPARGRNPRRR